ncbi:hypothetical protein ABK040_008096 [Willaertia magna]
MEITDPFNNDVTIAKLQEKVKYLKYGKNFFIILTQNNELYGYGNNDNNSLGNITSPKNELIKLEIDKKLKSNIKLLECGFHFTVIVNNINEFFCSGFLNSQMYRTTFTKIDITMNEKIKFIRCGFDCFFIITKNNSIYSFGDVKIGDEGVNLNKYLFIKSFNAEVKDLKCGSVHYMVLDINGNIYGIGKNYYGQLGIGDKKERFKFSKIKLPFKVKEITCKTYNTIILNEFNEIFISGYVCNIDRKYEEYISFRKFIIELKFKSLFYHFNIDNLFLTTNDEFYFGDKLSENTPIIEFRKIEKNSFKDYFYPIIFFNKLLIAKVDYEINEEITDKLGLRCLQKLKKKKCHKYAISIFNSNFEFKYNIYVPDKPLCICLDSLNNNIIISCFSYSIFLGSYNVIYKYSKDGKKLSEIKNEFNCVTDIAMDKLSGELYLCDSDNNRILIYTNDFKLIKQIGNDNTFTQPRCILINNKSELVVCDWSKTNCIKLFTKDGEYIKGFGKWGKGIGEFRAIKGVTFDFVNREYIISDSRNNKIQIMDEEGNFIKCFGKEGNNISEFKNLRRTLIDYSTGVLYVVDSNNNRIQLFK